MIVAGSTTMHLGITDWTQIGVAIATLFLAVATAFMAWKTKALVDQAREESEAVREQSAAVVTQAEASQEQVRTSQSILEASIRPWLTISPKTHPKVDSLDGQGMDVTCALRNVGAGLAIIQGAGPFRDRFTIEGKDSSGGQVTGWGFAASPAVPPGEETTLTFVKNVSTKALLGQDQGADGVIFINVPYTDAGGGQLVHAHIKLTYSKSGSRWLFHQISYKHDKDVDPFVTVEFDARPQSRRPRVL